MLLTKSKNPFRLLAVQMRWKLLVAYETNKLSTTAYARLVEQAQELIRIADGSRGRVVDFIAKLRELEASV